MIDSVDEDEPDCQYCGLTVASTDERRVVTTIEEGTAIHTHFCSDDCLAAWKS
ncbi:hypothetical protein ACFO5R_18515 [Halosolutus amylolyticus]|uniref:TRASH domain-containing protein n=1 Tax=Halosolutus amylolyticus TaxID=2932267 RepID=A0ABD5PUF1_9EURY|nr:hypothetical protein [Halosolutus amylolyticus]